MMREVLFWRAVIIILAITCFLATPASVSAATLRDLLKKQADLQQQALESKKKIEQKKQEAASLQDKISDLEGDITDTQQRVSNTEEQISLTNQVIEQLATQIHDQQGRLDDFNTKLRSAYINLYELSQTSPLEVMLQSDSLNELVSHTQYVQAIQTQLQSNITEVNSLLDDLGSKKQQSEQQKGNLVKLNNQLTTEQKALVNQKKQKDYLLNVTQGEQAKYEALVKQLENQQENLSQEIYQARLREASREQIIYGTGGYPWAGEPNPSAVDPWLFYKRQCTSYAAWRFGANFGIPFYNTRPGQGSAWNWPALAADQGYTTTRTPTAGSVVSWPIGPNMPYGHVAWVDGVNSDGTIDVSEYNWVSSRNFDQRKNVNPLRYGTPTYIRP